MAAKRPTPDKHYFISAIKPPLRARIHLGDTFALGPLSAIEKLAGDDCRAPIARICEGCPKCHNAEAQERKRIVREALLGEEE